MLWGWCPSPGCHQKLWLLQLISWAVDQQLIDCQQQQVITWYRRSPRLYSAITQIHSNNTLQKASRIQWESLWSSKNIYRKDRLKSQYLQLDLCHYIIVFHPHVHAPHHLIITCPFHYGRVWELLWSDAQSSYKKKSVQSWNSKHHGEDLHILKWHFLWPDFQLVWPLNNVFVFHLSFLTVVGHAGSGTSYTCDSPCY